MNIRQRIFSKIIFAAFLLGGVLSAQDKDVNWPSFRGNYASGVADGQNLPDEWDGASGKNVKWKTLIPGLAHSSPIIWGDKLFITTAVSGKGKADFRHGLYGDGDASDDRSVHKWLVYCLNKRNGEVLWKSLAHEGKPVDKRHIKSTYANSTPATDGKYVVAFFGSQGVFAFDMDGRLLWSKDVGRLDVGAYDAPTYEWGPASSPIIHNGLVYVQCDTQNEDFLLALDAKTGETVWKATRDEDPTWGTPTIFPDENREQLLTNGSNFIRSYNPKTGDELWRLGGSSKITAPTPIFKDDILVVASGRRPEKPIFAVRASASGDITLAEGENSNQHVLWNKRGRGPYMPTPIIYGDYLYTLQNQGVLDAYDLKTGEEFYRQRISHSGGGFSASPVAADGKLYLSGEDGDVFVVKAGKTYEQVAKNDMGERLMSSPALSEGVLYIRAQNHLFAIGK